MPVPITMSSDRISYFLGDVPWRLYLLVEAAITTFDSLSSDLEASCVTEHMHTLQEIKQSITTVEMLARLLSVEFKLGELRDFAYDTEDMFGLCKYVLLADKVQDAISNSSSLGDITYRMRLMSQRIFLYSRRLITEDIGSFSLREIRIGKHSASKRGWYDIVDRLVGIHLDGNDRYITQAGTNGLPNLIKVQACVVNMLDIDGCENLEIVVFQGVFLTHLKITDCPQLCFSRDMQLPSYVGTLDINDCPLLTPWCHKHKDIELACINKIMIDGNLQDRDESF